MTDQSFSPEISQRKKPRSPSAPSWPLDDCMDICNQLHNSYGHGSFNRAEIASTLSLSSSSSSFASLIATLKSYGLVGDTSGGEMSLAQSYWEFRAKENVQSNALAAIRRSKVFAALMDSFGGKLPDIPAIVLRLENSYEFNTRRANLVAAALDSSLRWAKLIDARNNILPPRSDDTPDEGANSIAGDSPPRDTMKPNESENSNGGAPGGVHSPAYRARSGELMSAQISLNSSGRIAIVQYPIDMTDGEADRLAGIIKSLGLAPELTDDKAKSSSDGK